MVKQDSGIIGQYILTGSFNWGDNGFYPACYECTTLTPTLSLLDKRRLVSSLAVTLTST